MGKTSTLLSFLFRGFNFGSSERKSGIMKAALDLPHVTTSGVYIGMLFPFSSVFYSIVTEWVCTK